MLEGSVSHANLDNAAILKKIQSKTIYWDLKNQLFQKLLNSGIPIAEWHKEIPNLASTNRIDTKIKQLIFDISKTIIKHDPIKSDAVALIDQARSTWTEFLTKNLINISNRLLAYMSEPRREDQERREFEGIIYDSNHLRNACVSVCFFKSKQRENLGGYFNVEAKYKFDSIDIFELKTIFAEIAPKEKNLIGFEDDDPDWVIERENVGEILMNKGGTLDVENFAKRGIPNDLRIGMYRKYFQIDKATRSKHFANIQESLKNHKYIIDEVINRDVREVLNDDRYFVFDENLQKAIWTFFRDKQVYEKLAVT